MNFHIKLTSNVATFLYVSFVASMQKHTQTTLLLPYSNNIPTNVSGVELQHIFH